LTRGALASLALLLSCAVLLF